MIDTTSNKISQKKKSDNTGQYERLRFEVLDI